MNTRKRNFLFGLTGLIIILLALPMSLNAQDDDEPERDFTNILISLDYHHPFITPFPHAEKKGNVCGLFDRLTPFPRWQATFMP